MSGWNGRIGSQLFVYEHTHVGLIAVNQYTRGREKTHARVFFDSFFCDAFYHAIDYSKSV